MIIFYCYYTLVISGIYGKMLCNFYKHFSLYHKNIYFKESPSHDAMVNDEVCLRFPSHLPAAAAC